MRWPPWSVRLSLFILGLLIIGLAAWSTRASLRNNELLKALTETQLELRVREKEINELQVQIEESISKTEQQLVREIRELQSRIARLRVQVRELGGTPTNGASKGEGERGVSAQGPQGPQGPPGGRGPRGDPGPRGEPPPPPPRPRPDCAVRIPLIDICLIPATGSSTTDPLL